MSEFLIDFIYIFLAAAPGRTTFILILLGASTPAARVLSGAVPAFVLQCLIAVLAGQFLKDIPAAYVQVGAGVLFLYFAHKFWRESRTSPGEASLRAEKSTRAIFALFFAAELGDVSQLAIAARAAQATSPGIVALSAVAAMLSLTLVAVFLGKSLGHALKPTLLQRAAAIAFLLLGIYLIASRILSVANATT